MYPVGTGTWRLGGWGQILTVSYFSTLGPDFMGQAPWLSLVPEVGRLNQMRELKPLPRGHCSAGTNVITIFLEW